jgi:hypothetical protein
MSFPVRLVSVAKPLQSLCSLPRISPLPKIQYSSPTHRRALQRCSTKFSQSRFSSTSTETQPRLRLGSTAPNFKAKTTQGDIDFHQWADNSWVILFSHPADFTPVCTTELGAFAKLQGEFEKRGVKMIGLVSLKLLFHISSSHFSSLALPSLTLFSLSWSSIFSRVKIDLILKVSLELYLI